jgi:hypothetical protein
MIAKPQLGSGVLKFEDADLLPQGVEFHSQVMSGAEEAPNQERKARRNRIMGPVYTTQSMGRRVLQVANFAN